MNCRLTAAPEYGKPLYDRMANFAPLADFLAERNCEGKVFPRIHRDTVPSWGEEGEAIYDEYLEKIAAEMNGLTVDEDCRVQIELPTIRPWLWFQLSSVVDSQCMDGELHLADFVGYQVECVAQTVSERTELVGLFREAVRVGWKPEPFGELMVDEVIIEDAADTYEPHSLRGANWGFHYSAFEVQIAPIGLIDVKE